MVGLKQLKVPFLACDLPVWSLRALSVSAWVLSGYSSFLTPPEACDLLIGRSTFAVGVNGSVHGCLFSC